MSSLSSPESHAQNPDGHARQMVPLGDLLDNEARQAFVDPNRQDTKPKLLQNAASCKGVLHKAGPSSEPGPRRFPKPQVVLHQTVQDAVVVEPASETSM